MWLPDLLRPTYPQEYLSVAAEACDDLWRLELDGDDIMHRHLFLGYRPLVIAVSGPDRSSGELLLRSSLDPRPVAEIAMKKIDLPGIGSGIRSFTGERARSRFLPWSQWPMDRYRRWRNAQRSGNVATVASEIDMTRIMYARPREIHMAVVGPPGRCNIFPTDLHGRIEDDEGYLISLRHAGKACAQVMEMGRFALFRMALDRHREVYALGGRHMGSWADASTITSIDGQWNGHARPAGVLAVRQLRIEAHHDVGIHRIFRCRVEKEEMLNKEAVLAHVHASPATWLFRHGRALDVRLR